jgi:hypothetical protein
MAGVERLEIDGVPVFTAPLPPGLQSRSGVTLTFRVGLADEELARLGLSHTVEHLALSALPRSSMVMNGSVAESQTEFTCEGEPEEVARFVRDVTTALSDLPVERLEAEKRVLATEARYWEDTAEKHLLSVRFGARTYGLSRYRQFGLLTLTERDVLAWARDRFTRGNVVAWVAGEVPSELAFRLPDGPRQPPVPPEPLPGIKLPVYSDYGAGGAAAGFQIDRSFAAGIAIDIAAERLRGRLRHERGVSYDVATPRARLTADVAHIAVVADAAEGHEAEVRDEIVRVVDQLAASGPTHDELQRRVIEVERAFARADFDLGWLVIQAEAELMGAPLPTLDEWRHELASVDEQAVAGALRDARQEMTLCAPAGLTPPPAGDLKWSNRVREIPPVEGREYRPRRRRLRRSGDRIVVGEEGISLIRQEPSPVTVTVRYEDFAVVKVLPGGKHKINSVDESWIDVDPAGIERGDEIIAALREALPPWKFVPVDS